MLSRSDSSNILNEVAETEMPKSNENESNTKQSLNEELKNMFAKELSISLSLAREARRSGFIKRATEDLYQSVETKDFWKINKSNGTIERVIDVDKQGIAKE